MSYDDDISIDENALDIAWLEQPKLMETYCTNMAEALHEQDLAEERVDFIKAQLDNQIRNHPESFGISKLTEGAITSAIITNNEYTEIYRIYLDKKYIYEVAKGAVRAFEHRKSALENLVRLHGQAYFAGPSVPRDLSEERRQLANRKVRINRSS